MVMQAPGDWSAPHYVFHNPAYPTVHDREGYKKLVSSARMAYPDLHYTIDELIAAEGDRVVARYTMRGTDKGGSVALGTPPTGKQVEMSVFTIHRFAGGKIVEEWSLTDMYSVMQQLGQAPRRG
jgi:steroid delta-isomerase-like uncharacterized protein